MIDNVQNRQGWRNIRRKPHFFGTEAIVRMAKRLRLDLSKLGGFDGCNQKMRVNPLTDFIVASYERRFGKYVK